jgi:hypothetical protein
VELSKIRVDEFKEKEMYEIGGWLLLVIAVDNTAKKTAAVKEILEVVSIPGTYFNQSDG